MAYRSGEQLTYRTRGRGVAAHLVVALVCLGAGPASATEPAAGAPPQAAGAPSDEEPTQDGAGLLDALNELFAPAKIVADLGRIVSGRDPVSLVILAGGVGLSAAAVGAADDWAFGAIPEGTLGKVGDRLSNVGSAIVVIPALIGTFAAGKGLRKPGVTRSATQMTQAVLMAGLLVTPTKFAVGRRRPDGSNQLSYPSGHTATAFAIAGVLEHEYGLAGALPGYAFAVFMGAARIDGRKHHLSDVIAGAAMGAVAARAVGHRFGDGGLVVHPIQGPAGGGGLGFTIVY